MGLAALKQRTEVRNQNRACNVSLNIVLHFPRLPCEQAPSSVIGVPGIRRRDFPLQQ
jgi:hypothetical protein